MLCDYAPVTDVLRPRGRLCWTSWPHRSGAGRLLAVYGVEYTAWKRADGVYLLDRAGRPFGQMGSLADVESKIRAMEGLD